MNNTPDHFIDLNAYPLTPSGTPEWHQLVNKHGQSLRENGASIMKGVIKEDILNRMTAEADLCLP